MHQSEKERLANECDVDGKSMHFRLHTHENRTKKKNNNSKNGELSFYGKLALVSVDEARKLCIEIEWKWKKKRKQQWLDWCMVKIQYYSTAKWLSAVIAVRFGSCTFILSFVVRQWFHNVAHLCCHRRYHKAHVENATANADVLSLANKRKKRGMTWSEGWANRAQSYQW